MVLAPRGAARTAKEGAGDCEPEAGREPEREAAHAARQDHAGARGTAKTASEPGLPGSGGGQSREDRQTGRGRDFRPPLPPEPRLPPERMRGPTQLRVGCGSPLSLMTVSDSSLCRVVGSWSAFSIENC